MKYVQMVRYNPPICRWMATTFPSINFCDISALSKIFIVFTIVFFKVLKLRILSIKKIFDLNSIPFPRLKQKALKHNSMELFFATV